MSLLFLASYPNVLFEKLYSRQSVPHQNHDTPLQFGLRLRDVISITNQSGAGLAEVKDASVRAKHHTKTVLRRLPKVLTAILLLAQLTLQYSWNSSRRTMAARSPTKTLA